MILSLKKNLPMKKIAIPRLSIGEETLAQQLSALKIPFCREYRFHPERKWRFDFFLVFRKIAIEVEGGLYGGRHTKPEGFENDARKYNEAAAMGFLVLRFSTQMVKSGEAINFIEKLI